MSNNEIDAGIKAARDACTMKQQRFVEEVFKGIPASTAYRNSGYSVTTDKAARANASRLLTKDSVKAYLSLLRDGDTGSAILTRRERLELLTDNARDSFKEKARNAVVSSVRELNKMTDEYRAESVNVTSDVTLFEAITGKRRKAL